MAEPNRIEEHPGVQARSGFHFSDLLVVDRILTNRLEHLRSQIDPNCWPPPPIAFALESPVQDGMAPDWDVQERRANTIVFEEVKSGPLSRDDRLSFWRRLRVTALAAPNTTITPRLTTNADKPTPKAEHWRALPTTSSRVKGKRLTSPPKFLTAKHLASEALFELTRVSDGAPGVSLVDAKQLLAAFVFSDDAKGTQLEQTLRLKIAELLGMAEGVEQTLSALVGNLTRRAADSDIARRQFTPDEIWNETKLLAQLTTFDPQAIRLWQELGPNAAGVSATTESSWIPTQPLQSVQPDITKALGASPSCLALIGRGGLGKTFALRQLHDEAKQRGPVRWIDADNLLNKDLAKLTDAISIGALALDATTTSPLIVFVDAMEGGANTSSDLRRTFAGLKGATQRSNVRVVVSIRPTSWNEVLEGKESLPGWSPFEFKEWSVELIQHLSQAAQRPLTLTLLRLLQTPFFLDLFLRTFGISEVIPNGLETAHGILREYWRRRILPEGAAGASRRDVLDRVCACEAEGQTSHVLRDEAANQLGSEGVFTMRQGAYVFRHALLRDYALMCWATKSPGIALENIRSIRDSFVRWGTLTAFLQASGSPYANEDGLPHLETALSAQGIEDLAVPIANVLGELETPVNIDLRPIVQTVEWARGGTFVERIIRIATIARNRGWLAWLASLEQSVTWAEHANWIGPEFLEVVRCYLELFERPDQHSTRLAQSIRIWSSAQKFAGVNWIPLVPLVAKHCADKETLEWLRLRATSDDHRQRWGARDALACWIASAGNAAANLNQSLLREIYVNASELSDGSAGIVGGKASIPADMLTYERTNAVLLGEGKQGGGLLAMAPEIFLPVALARLRGLAEENKKSFWNTPSHRVDIDALPPQARQLVFQIRQQFGPEISVEEALEGLVDDIMDVGVPERDHLVDGVRSHFTKRLDDDTAQGDSLLSFVRESHSASAAKILIEVLSEQHPKQSDLLDAVLQQANAYQVLGLHLALYKALRLRWATMNPSQRENVFDAIARIANSPTMDGFLRVAPLLLALPEHDLPAHLRQFLAVPTACESPLTPPIDDAVIIEMVNQVSVLDQHMNEGPWVALSRAISSGRLISYSGAEFQEFVTSVLEALSDVPVSSGDIPMESFACISSMLNEDLRRHAATAERTLKEEDFDKIISFARGVVHAHGVDSINKDPSPVNVGEQLSIRYDHYFCCAIDCWSTALRWSPRQSRQVAGESLFAEVEAALRTPSPQLTVFLLQAIHPSQWAEYGHEILMGVVSNSNSPAVQCAALRHVFRLDSKKQTDILKSWLEAPTPSLDRALDDSSRLCGEIGTALGIRWMLDDVERSSGAQAQIDCALAIRSGLMTDANCRAAFCVGLADGASETFPRATHLDPSRYAAAMRRVWQELKGRDAKRVDVFASHLAHTLGCRKPTGDLITIWDAIEPLAVEVVQEGRLTMVFSLLSELGNRIAPLPPARFCRFADVLKMRASQIDFMSNDGAPYQWSLVIYSATRILRSVAQRSEDQRFRTKIHDILDHWGARGIGDAVEAARALRVSSPEQST